MAYIQACYIKNEHAVSKVALVAATVLVSIWVIMWLDLPPIFNAPLPAGQKVAAVVSPKAERVVSLSGPVIQSVPDPELATVKDITSTRLISAQSPQPQREIEREIELPGWLRITKKTSIERIDKVSYPKVRFVRAEDIVKFSKLVEVIGMADLRSSYQFVGIRERSAPNLLLSEVVKVPHAEVRGIIDFMEGKQASVNEGKEYNWTIMFGMNIYVVQMQVSALPPKSN